MGLSKKEKENKVYLNNILNIFRYIFLGILFGNIGTIFMGVFDKQDNILKIIGIFLIWLIIPSISFIKVENKLTNIVKNNVLYKIIKCIIILSIIIGSGFILICIAINIQNSVIDPEKPITIFKWISNLF